MPRVTPAQSDSESERVPSKKQKKKAESPVDDPMDQDEEDRDQEPGDEHKGEEDEEYEIEEILDRSYKIFKDEVAYYVKWRGYGEVDNSWVRESDAPNAGELISAFLDKKSKQDKASSKKKASTKPRKSAERPHEPKKRGRVSTKPKPESDEEEPERSPVQPVTKKQKKAPASARKKEPDHEEDPDTGDFAAMDKYMELSSWDGIIQKIDTIERDREGNLFLYGTLTTGEAFRLPSTLANARFPQKIIQFYEGNLRWKSGDDAE